MSQDHADIYRRLGVEPVVNCGSSRSVYGNSTQSDPVRTAMESASHHHVIMEELGDAAGQRLAELTGTEWGLVTAGSATGLALGAARVAFPACGGRGGGPGPPPRPPAVRPGRRGVAMLEG